MLESSAPVVPVGTRPEFEGSLSLIRIHPKSANVNLVSCSLVDVNLVKPFTTVRDFKDESFFIENCLVWLFYGKRKCSINIESQPL